MENSIAGIQKNLVDGLQMFADLSVSALKSSMVNSVQTVEGYKKAMSDIGIQSFKIPNIYGGKTSKDCCPPIEECPPHCILQIERHALSGERIKVPFIIKNTCNESKSYQVGVRELKNIDGSLAPSQPALNKNHVTLEAGAEEMVLLSLDLIDYSAGSSYIAEIVIREKDVNQNICFTLKVNGLNEVPTAKPHDEKKYMVHWQSWRSHFYRDVKSPS